MLFFSVWYNRHISVALEMRDDCRIELKRVEVKEEKIRAKCESCMQYEAYVRKTYIPSLTETLQMTL